jgi:sulfate adenylyltransferase subunit 1
VLPAGRSNVVTGIVTLDGEQSIAVAGDGVTLLLRDELDISRGDMLADPAYPPRVAKNMDALVCWFSDEPFSPSGRYLLKHATRTVKARVSAVKYRVDIHTLEHEPAPGGISMNDIVHLSLSLNQPICCDAYRDDRATGSFILIDEVNNHTVAAGLIQ